MSDDNADNSAPDPSGSGRRSGDRRKAQMPLDGPDRRKGDRRLGADRRDAPRTEVSDQAED